MITAQPLKAFFNSLSTAACILLLIAMAIPGCAPSADGSNHPSAVGKAAAKETGPAATENTTNAPATETRTADQILKDMEKAYRQATTYADDGNVILHFDRGGKPLEDKFPFAISFSRPNKLRLVCYDAMAVSDGQLFHASVKGIPNLVLEIPAPNPLTIEDVLRDPQLQAALVQTPAGPPVQLHVLLREDTAAQLMLNATSPAKLLPAEPIDGRYCNRIEITKPDGKLVLWIDQQDNLIRRIALPTDEFKKQLNEGGPVSNVSLTINLDKAQINRPIDELAFKFEVPENATKASSLMPVVKPAEIAPHTDPANYKLTKLWSATDLKEPGNLLVVDVPDAGPRIFVLDGWRAVAEIDAEGKLVARHELDIPAEAIVTNLQTATDSQGKRYFVASGPAQPQFFVFDDAWQKLLDFPKPEDSAGMGLSAVRIADLKGEGKPTLYVGYLGDAGLQGVSLDGNRLWSERSLQFAMPCAVTEPDASDQRRLLCTHRSGTIILFSAEGKPQGEVVVPNRFVSIVDSADLNHDGKNSYCALALTAEEKNEAIGIALDGRQLWTYPLPDGVHGRPIDIISTGDVTGEAAGQWLLAGSDGSIHIVGADGKPIEKWNHGAALTGLAATKLADHRVLLVASLLEKPDGDTKAVLEAFQVEPVEK
jgi:outer membrane lipoprotein-sorting protein